MDGAVRMMSRKKGKSFNVLSWTRENPYIYILHGLGQKEKRHLSVLEWSKLDLRAIGRGEE